MNQIYIIIYVLDLKFYFECNGGVHFHYCQGNDELLKWEGKRECWK